MMESRVSALVDGELEQEEAIEMLVAATREQKTLQQEWMLFHLIGDTLRQTPPLSPDFNTRFSEQLAKEPTILAPRRFFQHKRSLMALSAAASVAAVSLVAWVALQFNNVSGLTAPANTIVAETSPSGSAPAINVSSYLSAHQEYSYAVQGISPYQRASLEKPQGGGR
ncbi:MAG: sigma-E factor negative regulatory protein [Betaproteobacteria bacterium]|nr:sigma-E factor negative regulatory protein [Betaproteobacteria bacterium]